MLRRSTAAAAVIATAACAPALAAPTTVDLRVEGLTQTIYEGPVTTDAKTIQMDGSHRCDGTNNGANPAPGPTMTTALDDGAAANGFTWQGTWYEQNFQDYGIDRIGPDANDFATGRYWGYALDYTAVTSGGCQQLVQAGDDVLFAYDFFSKSHLLRLEAPARAETNQPVDVRVVDGQDGKPVSHASVGGTLTGPDGRATLSFDSPGIRSLKAERADSVRSNRADVCVYAPGSGDCGSDRAPSPSRTLPEASGPEGDDVPPSASISSLRDGAVYRRAPRTVSGRVDEDRAIHQVYLRLRMVDRGGCRWLSGRREVFTRPRTCDRARFIRLGDDADWSYLLPFSLPQGARYIVDVKVLDRSLNRDVEQVRFRVRG